MVFGSLLVVALSGAGASDGGGSSRNPGTNAPAPVEQSYPVSTGHWVDLVMDRGVKVKLEDGSIWEIAPKNQFQTATWRVAQKISVSQNPDSRYPFRLTNADQKATVDARLAARPR